MSSHHFVKEDQEPALLIADSSAVSPNVAEQLLEWSPTIVVLERALEVVLSWGIKIDVVVCHSDRVLELLRQMQAQAPVKFLSYNDGDCPLDTAMMFLVAGKYRAVNVIGGVKETVEPYTSSLDVVLFHSGKRWSLARNGKFEKWLAKGSHLFIDTDIQSAENLDRDGKVVQDGLVRIYAPFSFWIGEPAG